MASLGHWFASTVAYPNGQARRSRHTTSTASASCCTPAVAGTGWLRPIQTNGLSIWMTVHDQRCLDICAEMFKCAEKFQRRHSRGNYIAVPRLAEGCRGNGCRGQQVAKGPDGDAFLDGYRIGLLQSDGAGDQVKVDSQTSPWTLGYRIGLAGWAIKLPGPSFVERARNACRRK